MPTLDEVDPKSFRTVWRRIVALLIDSFVVGATQLIVLKTDHETSAIDARVGVLAVECALALSYWIALHALFGQTFGKWVMRVRLVRLDLGPITWFQAVVRELPGIALTVVELGTRIRGLDLGEHPLGGIDRLWGFALAGVAWVILDVITMLASKRRRALHDFLARTIVVRVGKGRRVAGLRLAVT